MKFLAFLTPKRKARATSSDFSRFIREASSGEKKVYMEVAKKASEEQRKVIQEYREMVAQ